MSKITSSIVATEIGRSIVADVIDFAMKTPSEPEDKKLLQSPVWLFLRDLGAIAWQIHREKQKRLAEFKAGEKQERRRPTF